MTPLNVPISGANATRTVTAYEDKLRRHPGDCGIDLYPMATVKEELIWSSFGFYSVVSVPTRISVLIPEGYFAWITGRSSSPDKLMGCMVITGVIDHGYTGEYRIRVQVPDVTDRQKHGMLANRILDHTRDRTAIAQAIILPYAQARFIYEDELPMTERGSAGFGSTDNQAHAIDQHGVAR